MKRIILIGATGSIGGQTMDVVASAPERFQLVGLSAHRNEAGLLEAGRRFPGSRLALTGANPADPSIGLSGTAGLEELLRDTDADIVVNSAAGAEGLLCSLAALESGKDLALANKESIVMAWSLLCAEAASHGKRILPVDSEHAALFQLTQRIGMEDIDELVITASGGAFRDRPLDALADVTPDEAASHPNWRMGRKITIDSATMANKGLEVIESCKLFSCEPRRIKVLVHPQSLVHALVRTRDGSLYAQVSEPDMRVPIQNALTWPDTIPCPFGRLDLAGRVMDFRDPDPLRYPLLGLAYSALASGEGATIAYNAADEVAVAAFEEGRIGFLDIARVVEACLRHSWPFRITDAGSIFETDAEARKAASFALRETR